MRKLWLAAAVGFAVGISTWAIPYNIGWQRGNAVGSKRIAAICVAELDRFMETYTCRPRRGH